MDSPVLALMLREGELGQGPLYPDSGQGFGHQWSMGSCLSSLCDWSKLSLLSGLSLPIEGFP